MDNPFTAEQRNVDGAGPEPLTFTGDDIDPADPDASFDAIGLAMDSDEHDRAGYWQDRAHAAEQAQAECEGHPAGEFEPMGETAYCDGSCKGGA